MKRAAGYIGSLVVLLFHLPPAAACPFCKSETGQQVQAGIFNDQFWTNVALTLLPLFVLLGIVALIYFDLSWLWTPSKARVDEESPTSLLS